MNKKNILIIGLGRVGQRFYTNFTWHYSGSYDVIAVIEKNQNNPIIDDLLDKDIAYFSKIDEAISTLGSEVDIIMDTTYCQNVAQKVQALLQETGNHHTVVISMVDYLKCQDEEQLIESVVHQHMLVAS